MKAETLFREAFERLKTNSPINVPKGTKVSQNNIAKEAGKHPTALKKDRFPLLVLEIQDFLKQQEIETGQTENTRQLRKKRALEDRLIDCKNQRDKLSSICQAQAELIETLRDELNNFQKGLVKPTNLR